MISKKYESNDTVIEIQDIDILNVSVSDDSSINIEATENCIVSFRKKENKVHIISNQIEDDDGKPQITITEGIIGRRGIVAKRVDIGRVTGQLAIGENIVQYQDGRYNRASKANINISVPKGTEILIEDVKMIIRNYKKEDEIKIKVNQ